MGNNWNDSPGVGLNTSVKAAEVFEATVYLMWDPALPSDPGSPCVPAHTAGSGDVPSKGCSSIPVPLGYVSWNWNAYAVNTMNTALGDHGTVWKLDGCTSPVTPNTNASAFQD